MVRATTRTKSTAAQRATGSRTLAAAPPNQPGNNGQKKSRRRKASAAAHATIGVDEVRHLPKAPSDYHDIARQFADALEWTKFRGAVSPAKLRRMLERDTRLSQRAEAAQLKAAAAARLRMVQASQAWKSMLSAWRLVVAAMPDRPELEKPFAFMQTYMAVGRSTPAAPPIPAAPAS